MPSAEEKVVLQLSLDLKDAKKDMKDFRKDVKGVQKETVAASKDTDKAWRNQKKTLDELAKTVRLLAQVTVEAERKRQHEAKKTTDTFKKQEESLKKQEETIKRIGKEIRGRATQTSAGPSGVAEHRRPGLGRRTWNAGIGLASSVGGFFMGGVNSGFQQYMGYGQAQFGLTGMGTPRGLRQGLRGARGVGGATLGFGPTETVQQAAQVGRQTGSIGSVYQAQQLAQAGGGMGVGEAGGIMGGFREAGLRFGLGREAKTKADRREDIRLQRDASKTMGSLIEGGMVSGMDKAKLPEYLQTVSRFAEEAGGRQFGKVNLKGIGAGLTQLMGELGVTPRRAAGVATQMDQMIRTPGAGEAGNALVMQAFGFGKPGGQTSYYDALKRQQQGFKGMGGRKNLQDVFKEVYTQYGATGEGGKGPGQQEANIVLSQLSGMTLDQVESLGEVLNSNVSQEEKMKKIKEAMEKSEPLEKQALKESKKGFAGIKKHLSAIEGEMLGVGTKFAPEMLDFQKMQIEMLKSMAPHVRSGMDALKTVIGPLSATLKRIAEAVEGVAAFFGVGKQSNPGRSKNQEDMSEASLGRVKESLEQAKKAKTFGSMRGKYREAQTSIDALHGQKNLLLSAKDNITLGSIQNPVFERSQITDKVMKQISSVQDPKLKTRMMNMKLPSSDLRKINSYMAPTSKTGSFTGNQRQAVADEIFQVLLQAAKRGGRKVGPLAAVTPPPVWQPSYTSARPGDPRRDAAGHDSNVIGSQPGATSGSSQGKTA